MIGERKDINTLDKGIFQKDRLTTVIKSREGRPMENPEWRTRYWDDSEVTQLLALWGDKNVQRELDGTRRDNQVFIKLSEDLRRRGILRSPAQVREKIKILKREYRLCLGRHSSTGPGAGPPGVGGGKGVMPGKFKYFDQMKEILGGSPVAGRSPTSQSVPSPNETSNENMSTCASNYLDYLQNYGKSPTEPSSYDAKPLDLHVSSEAVNNLLRGISPKDAAKESEATNRGIITYGIPPPTLSPQIGYSKRPYSQMVGPRSDDEDTSESETNEGTSEKRSRYYFEPSTVPTTKVHKNDNEVLLVQDILDRIFNYFRESDERFFQLEERRMKHEKELELLRQERETRLLDKLCQLTKEATAYTSNYCHSCHKELAARVDRDTQSQPQSKEPKPGDTAQELTTTEDPKMD